MILGKPNLRHSPSITATQMTPDSWTYCALHSNIAQEYSLAFDILVDRQTHAQTVSPPHLSLLEFYTSTSTHLGCWAYYPCPMPPTLRLSLSSLSHYNIMSCTNYKFQSIFK